MKDEITLLREENERLKLLLNLVIDRLRLEKPAEYATLTTETASHSAVYSHASDADTIRNEVYSHAFSGNATPNNVYSNASGMEGIKHNIYSDAESGNSIQQEFYSHAAEKDGITNVSYSNLPGNNGIINNIYPDAGTGNSIPNKIPSDATRGNVIPNISYPNSPAVNSTAITGNAQRPAFIDISNIYHYKLEKELRALMTTCRTSSISNAGKIIVHLYSNPKASYETLRKLTGLSPTGMAKHIMSLKRRGLIVRSSFQHYTLTSLAISILQKATP